MAFLFRNLDVYKESCAFIKEADVIASLLLPANSGLADQLRRAAASVPANIAEGYGRWHTKDKVQFYRFALGSVNECVGHLDVLAQKGSIENSNFNSIANNSIELRKCCNA